jgi:predicted MPP superfamily phosphohydrolase
LLRRLLHPFVAVLTVILALGYAYIALRFFTSWWSRLLLFLPFLFVWLIPVLYWAGEREGKSRLDHLLHFGGYLSMGFLSFLLVFALTTEVLGLLLRLVGLPVELGGVAGPVVVGLAGLGVLAGALTALRGPAVTEVEIPLEGLPEELDGFRIAQISDLHVGPTIRRPYVERVVAKTWELAPDLVALTGDIVDGSVEDLAADVAPLARLAPKDRLYFITGNHEYYSGASRWIEHFKALGFKTLLNDGEVIEVGACRLLIGGVIDPAARIKDPAARPDTERAAHGTADLKILLAHNPKLAADGAKAGFDQQLSGHTHAGQFFPWTLVTRLVHAPHYAGLSRQGRMWVYVSAGTGTWGPPIRLGTRPELTLIRLVRPQSA